MDGKGKGVLTLLLRCCVVEGRKGSEVRAGVGFLSRFADIHMHESVTTSAC